LRAEQRPRFYGWYIAGCCLVVFFFTNGLSLYVPQNLFPRFMETFGATPAEVSRTTAITFALAGIIAPFVGAAIDRFGVVRVIRTGLVLLALTFSAYPFAQSLQQLYVLHAAIAVGLVFCGLMPNIVLLSNWFITRRGTVVGLLVAGSSLAGATLPVAIAPLVNDPALGWRAGFGVLAAAFWLFALLPGFLVLRESPRVVGQFPDGAASAPSGAVDGEELREGVPFATALRSRTLWCLAIGSASIWFSIQAITSQFTIYLEQDAGFQPQNATRLYSTLLACSVAGKFLFGAISDRYTKRSMMLVASIILLAGCLQLFRLNDGVLALTHDPLQLTAFALVFGLGFGGSFTLIQLVAVESFGQLALGRILGVVIFIDTMGGAAGTLLAGQIRTTTGDYFLSFSVVTVVAIIAVINVLLIPAVAKTSSKR
jgi:sugar phosphate permease